MSVAVQHRETDNRFNHEGDWLVRQFCSDADRCLSAEEYAAWHAQDWECFPFYLYRYRDPALGAWVRCLGEFLFLDGEVERCR